MNRKAKALEFIDEDYKIQVTGRHIQITDAMKDYAIEKISKIERFMNRIIDVNVIMDIQKLDHRVEIILKAGNLKVTSQATTTDMYASIDKAAERLQTRLLRFKTRIQDHHAKKLSEVDIVVNVIRRPENDEEDFDDVELNDSFSQELNGNNQNVNSHSIVEQKSLSLKTLNQEEALMKMELSRDAFLIYRNEENQKINVIYRLRNGDYGVIEPEC
jgi:putative sigma-54 modulation protein